MRWAARSVMPTLVATSRSRTAGSRTMQRRTWVWLVTNFQVPWDASFDIDVLSVVYFVSCLIYRELCISRFESYVSTGQGSRRPSGGEQHGAVRDRSRLRTPAGGPRQRPAACCRGHARAARQLLGGRPRADAS